METQWHCPGIARLNAIIKLKLKMEKNKKMEKKKKKNLLDGHCCPVYGEVGRDI